MPARIPSLLAATLLVVAASGIGRLNAQGTLPKGMDSTEGNTSSWDSFEIGSLFNPCKAVYSYDAGGFPWDPTQAHVIHTLSFRRDGPYSLKGQSRTGASTKRWAVWLSTHATASAARVDLNHFARAHGPNKTRVFGAPGIGKDVAFPSLPRPQSGPAAFHVSIPLDQPFTVPANSSCLVLEIRSYSESVNTAGWWRADAVRYSTSGWSPGSFTLLHPAQCVTPAITADNRSAVIGSSLCRVYRTLNAPGGMPMISWIGPRNPQVFKFPGTSCEVHVTPTFAVSTFTATSGTFTGVMDFGQIPEDVRLVGLLVHHQSAIFDASYPGGIGFSRGASSQVGSGFDPSRVHGVSVFSYGIHTAHEHGTANRSRAVVPDREIYARFATSRHPIVKIN